MSPYVRRLRDAYGSGLLLLPSAVALVHNQAGEVLLVRQIGSSSWSCVGGGIEPGESPETTALREAKEETGLVVELGPVLAVLGGEHFRVTYANGDLVEYVAVVYSARVVAGDLRADGFEVEEARFYNEDEIAHLELEPLVRHLFTARLLFA